MSRPHRDAILIPEIANHITLRGNNRRRIFSASHERDEFVWLLSKALSVTKCLLHHLSLLTNHVHMILTPPTVKAASDCIRGVCQPYSAKRNRRREASGKLFEERFGSHAIENEKHMAIVGPYVDRNPDDAGLGPRLRMWSTLAIHTGEGVSRIPRDIWTPSPWYLSLGPTPCERQLAYRDAIDEFVAYRDARRSALGESSRQRFERPDRTSAR